MNPPMNQSLSKPASSKRKQEVSDMPGKGHQMLDRIRETREMCGDGVKMLPVVRYERKLWFFDEPLRQLRNVRNPHDFIDLNEFEMDYFSRRVI